MLVKVLHQSQHLNELAAPAIPHPRFHQPSQTINAIGEAPFVQRRGLIERLALVFQQGEIMQGIVDKLGPVVAANVGGDRLAAASYLDPVRVTLRQHLLLAVTRRNRIIIVAVTYQRQRRDAGGDLVAGVKGRRRQRHERGCVRLHALTDCRRLTAQDRLTPLHTGVENLALSASKLSATGKGVMKLRRTYPTKPSTLPLSLPLPGLPKRSANR